MKTVFAVSFGNETKIIGTNSTLMTISGKTNYKGNKIRTRNPERDH